MRETDSREHSTDNAHELTRPQVDPMEISPRWKSGTKRTVLTVLIVLALLALYRIRTLLIPVIMALVIAYVVLPIVDQITRRTPVKRGAAIAIVYLVIIAILVAIPVSTIPQLIAQGNNLLNNTPRYIRELGELLQEPITIGGYVIPLDQLPLEQAYAAISDNLLDIIQTIGRQGFNIFGDVASATLSTVGWIVIVLVLSFYMVKDYRELWGGIVEIAPESYHSDLQKLGREIAITWNAFLRGQLILGFIIAIITFVIALVIGLPNALLLALIAGLLEFVPNIGPVIAAIPAVLLALFQTQSSWLGSLVGPIWFAAIVVGLYVIIQQVENMILVPRIIGRSLNLHPLVVLIGALAGASVAGILGILLAAPLLASARLILLYIYRKLLDQPPFHEMADTVTPKLNPPDQDEQP